MPIFYSILVKPSSENSSLQSIIPPIQVRPAGKGLPLYIVQFAKLFSP